MLIENFCTNSPFGLVRQVQRSLRWIDQADLVGINRICLVDQLAAVSNNSAEKVYIHGAYYAGEDNEPPYILLSVKEIYKGIPSALYWTTIPTLCIGRTLAHEVAHHLVAIRGYVFKPGDVENDEESIADKYADFHIRGMMEKWYYRLAQWCIKDIADWYYVHGFFAASKQEYESAAESFFLAFNLNPDHPEAAKYYWRAKEMCNGKMAPSELINDR